MRSVFLRAGKTLAIIRYFADHSQRTSPIRFALALSRLAWSVGTLVGYLMAKLESSEE